MQPPTARHPPCASQGNVILTDHTYTVLTLLRSHRDDDKGTSTMARHPYPMHAIRLRQPLDLNTLRAALAAGTAAGAAAAAGPGDVAGAAAAAAAAAGGGAERGEADDGLGGGDGDEHEAQQQQEQQPKQQQAANGSAAAGKGGGGGGGGKKKAWAKAGGAGGGKGGGGPVLKAVLAELFPYGPAVAEHCCLSAGLQPGQALAAAPLSEAQVLALHGAVQQFEGWLAGLDQGAQAEGFISAVPAAGAGKHKAAAGGSGGGQGEGGSGDAAAAATQQAAGEGGDEPASKQRGAGLVYQDYNPLRLAQAGSKAGGEVLAFPSFDKALDDYYGKVKGAMRVFGRRSLQHGVRCFTHGGPVGAAQQQHRGHRTAAAAANPRHAPCTRPRPHPHRHTATPAPRTPTTQIQGQRVEVAKLDAERAALSRLDKIKVDQGARATALAAEAAASEARAALIEYNLEAVDAAIDAVNAGTRCVCGRSWQCVCARVRAWVSGAVASGCDMRVCLQSCCSMPMHPPLPHTHTYTRTTCTHSHCHGHGLARAGGADPRGAPLGQPRGRNHPQPAAGPEQGHAAAQQPAGRGGGARLCVPGGEAVVRARWWWPVQP
jgi:hypothetical protein